MKLRFTLKKLLRSYPITIVSILLLLICITIILIQSHVYAMSEGKNPQNGGCHLEPHACPEGTTQGQKCSAKKTTCYCMGPEEIRIYLNSYYYTCEGTITITGCSGYTYTRPCKEDDCDFGDQGCGNYTYPKDCGIYKTYKLDENNPCPGGYVPYCEVGCRYVVSE